MDKDPKTPTLDERWQEEPGIGILPDGKLNQVTEEDDDDDTVPDLDDEVLEG